MLSALPLLLVCCLGYIGKGNELMQAERYQEAAEQFKMALRQDQNLTQARRNLAICEFQTRQYREARDLFKSLPAGKEHVIATYYLGRLDIIDGKLDSAIARLRSIHGKEPEVIDAGYFLGMAYSKQGSYPQAIRALRSYIEVNPRDFRAHQWLARCLQKTGAAEEASREFAKTRELHEYYTNGSTLLGECRSLLDGGKRAEAWQKCGPMYQSDDVDKLTAVGMLFGQMNDQPHALAAWQRAVELDPDSPEINYNLAFAYFQGHDIQRAREYASKAFSLWPDFPEASVLYGTILYMTGPDTEAGRVLKHAHELRPEDANVVQLLDALRTRQN